MEIIRVRKAAAAARLARINGTPAVVAQGMPKTRRTAWARRPLLGDGSASISADTLGGIMFDACTLYDLVQGKPGAAAALLKEAGHLRVELPPGTAWKQGIAIISLKSSSLAGYFALIKSLPEPIDANSAPAVLTAKLGAEWPRLLLTDLDRHPAQARGRIAAALLSCEEKVRTLLATRPQKEKHSSRATPPTQRIAITPSAAPPTATSGTPPVAEPKKAAALDLLASYDVLSGQAASEFYEAHRAAIKKARTLVSTDEVRARSAALGEGLLARLDILTGAVARQFEAKHGGAIARAKAMLSADQRKANRRAAAVSLLAEYKALRGTDGIEFLRANKASINFARTLLARE